MRRIKILLFTILLIFLFTSTTVAATTVSFPDVTQFDWFYPNVVALAEKGIVSGYPDGTFKPQNKVTNAEALKLILGAAEIQPVPMPSGSNWSAGYISKADALGMIDSTSFNGTAYATRQEAATMFVKALGVDVNTVATSYFADTSDLNVETLKDLGIINGYQNSSGEWIFNPNSTISRAEISALVVRSNTYYTTYIKNTEGTDPNTPTFLLRKPVNAEEISIVNQPKTVDEFKKAFMYMVYTSKLEYTLKYSMTYDSLVDSDILDNFDLAYTEIFRECPEYFSYFSSVKTRIVGTGTSVSLTVTLTNKYNGSVGLAEKQSAYITAVENALNEMVDNGTLTSDMTEQQKALAMYRWICDYAEYDYDIETTDSFTGYGLMINKIAVCQGYTAVYNLMCRYLGITAQGMTGTGGPSREDHIWTAQILDGVEVLTDVTWGDQGDGNRTDEWFGRSADYFDDTHFWSSDEYAEWNDAPGLSN